MPSSSPFPARSTEAKTSFLPSSVGASIVVSGVSTSSRRQFQFARHLVAQEQRYLAQEPPEARRRGVLVAHDRQLVLDQRMIDDGHALELLVHLLPFRNAELPGLP
jgi:hypothetical protein